jgi:hypothetical protein
MSQASKATFEKGQLVHEPSMGYGIVLEDEGEVCVVQFESYKSDTAHTVNTKLLQAVSDSAVKAPSHYCDGRQYEPRKVIRDWGLSWEIGSAVKYLARAGRKDKDKQVEDLRKAIEFIQYEIEGLEASKNG